MDNLTFDWNCICCGNKNYDENKNNLIGGRIDRICNDCGEVHELFIETKPVVVSIDLK